MKWLIKISFFFPILLLSESKVLDLFVGTEQKGTFLFTTDNGQYIADENIIYGKCLSKNLSELGEYQEIDDKLFLKPKKECLENEVLSFKEQNHKYFKDSTSTFLNYSIIEKNNATTGTIGSGVFTYDTLFYTQRTISENQKNKLDNYFILKEFEENKIKVGTIYSTSGSYLINGYALEGIQISPNKYIVQNDKTFNFQLIINDQSTVEIYNNNQIIQKLTLNAGIYNLKDLPINHFSNNVKIIVTDSFGNAKEVDIPFLYNYNILAKDSIDYSLVIGKNEKEELIYSGFYRKGILDDFTIGYAFDYENIAFTSDYLTSFGKFGLQNDNKRNKAIDYSYSYEDYYFGIMQILKDEKKDFRIDTGVSGEFGNLSLKYTKNEQTIYGMSFSKMLNKNLNLSLNSNYNETQNTYTLGAKLIWNFNVANKIHTLSYSETRTDSIKNKYISTSMPIMDENKGFGYEANYEEQISNLNESDRYKILLKAKNKNNYWFNSQKIDNQITKDFGLSGSIGCVVTENLNCELGDVIYPESSYLLEDNGLKRIPSYWTTDVKNKFTSMPVTLKSGQGYWLDPSLYKTITGTIKVNNEPYNEKTFKVSNIEYFTGKDGKFWIDGFIGKKEDFIPQISNAVCTVNFMNIDEELNEVQIDCKEN